jgi:hypothetical protein
MDWYYALREALTAELNHDSEAIADGGAASWDDYQKRVGVRKGVKRALAVMEDVARKLSGEDGDS